MLQQCAFIMRRIRIRSWKDLAAVVAGVVIYLLISFGLPKLFPHISEKTANTIGVVATFITVLALLFGLNA